MRKLRPCITVAIDSGIFWPAKETKVAYQGQEFILCPETEQLAPTISLFFDPPLTTDQALLLIRRFLSTLSWVERGPLRESFHVGTAGHPAALVKSAAGRLVNPRFRLDYLPEVVDVKAQRCLAFYREAMNLNSAPFQFLSFFKIINVLHAKGADQTACINRTLPLLSEHHACSRLQQLQTLHADVGKYLYESGRCAVAHAFNQPLVDPDDPKDTQRLREDLPLIKAIAEQLIESQLGVKSAKTVRKEHLYELEGFRSLLGDVTVRALKAKQPVALAQLPKLPRLSIRIRGKEKYGAFEGLNTQIAGVQGGCVFVRCTSDDGLVALVFGLNFPAERIQFDAQTGVDVRDDGSAHAAKVALDDLRFFREHIANGELELWDADTGSRLGRTDPLVPINVSIRGTMAKLDRVQESLEIQLAVRSAPGEGAISI
jgi:hypothetical protein